MNTDNIFKLMVSRGISAKELSEKTGISTGNISDWKSGRSAPKADALIKIAHTLNVSVDYVTHGASTQMSEIIDFLGADKYCVKYVDGEDCICRTIGDYEIEISGCNHKSMRVDLFLWKLSDSNSPAYIDAYKYKITSKAELKTIIDFIEKNIHNISDFIICGELNVNTNPTKGANSHNTINGNNNIIGNGNVLREPLSEQEDALLRIFKKLDVIKQAQLLAYAVEFGKEE